ncbi:copper chaperone PCu(A)C [Paraburkholderia haematera]|uniref:Uncharacterized protein n=1 Tax=Paraburkholderia haematera TaxID=2793077 RepID=A0ABN7MIR1_9BURK|nr:hypothetical protein [Paraburkholderia haematera]CAE6808928.1 hypothetical protein R69888_05568 [Paraburkholderia haematera]
MKTSRQLLLAALLCGSSIQAFAGAAATASVSGCWIRALPGDLPSGGYFKAVNADSGRVRLKPRHIS